MPKAGRNDRCPCGSGKKFKRCCASERDPLDVAFGLHTVDDAVVRAALNHAYKAYPEWNWMATLGVDDEDVSRGQLFIPLAVLVEAAFDGKLRAVSCA